MTIDAYKSLTRSVSTNVETGIVRSYNPETKLYRVAIDGDRVRTCRATNSGIERPYDVNDYVIVLDIESLDRFIIAEYTPLQPTASSDRRSEEEIFAQTISENESLFYSSSETPYRKIDRKGEPEAPVFSGDVVIQNKAASHDDKSWIRLTSFGDLVIQSTAVCRQYFQKKTNTIYQRAARFIQEGFGYRRVLSTDIQGETKGKSILSESVAADALKPKDLCYQFSTGYLTDHTGTDVYFGDLMSVSVDNDKKIVTVNLKENYQIRFDAANKSLAVTNLEKSDQSIQVENDSLSLNHSGQYLKLTANGLSASVKNFDIKVDGTMTTSAGGPIMMKSDGIVDIQGTPIKLN